MRIPDEKLCALEVRSRVTGAYAEKVHEMGEAILGLQKLSRETVAITDKIRADCGKALPAASSV